MIFLEGMKKGHCQPDQHWTCFKGSAKEITERPGGAHAGLAECVETILNRAARSHVF